ncbi:hypothetical protein nbrc107696_18960 [Gordonia spumicola]|uniref:DUF2637 domain-containing protein n=1 Tax=Gordonia spumicola TaxID=589161 RepID=A0A7I9V8N0_9ACTN|nr:DUF2637 domain-containing protein [Gordonia spumicola]GEE01450.1 hypothetical protein nbrc107696_18960 [Gordonia spumicola]
MRPDAHRRGYYAGVLIVGVALSVVGNGLHAWSLWHAEHPDGASPSGLGPGWSVAGVTIFPVLLLMMTELLMLVVKRFDGAIGRVLIVIAAVVAAISFAISYESLAYTARVVLGVSPVLAWAAPLAVDLPIIGATIALWAASDRIRRDTAASDEGHSPYAAETFDERSPVFGEQSIAVSAVDLIDGADTELDRVLSANGMVTASGDRSTNTMTDEIGCSANASEAFAEHVGIAGEPVSPITCESLDEQRGDAAEQARSNTSEAFDERSASAGRAFAERVRQAANSRADAAVVERVLDLSAAGGSRRAVADAAGMSASTVSGLVRVAEELRAIEGQRRTALAVVNN